MMGSGQEPGVIPRLCAALFQRAGQLAQASPDAPELSVEVHCKKSLAVSIVPGQGEFGMLGSHPAPLR
jgi:hypothetical protein